MADTRPKVAILHHGFVPRYRLRFYEQLNAKGGARYVVFHGDPPAGSGHDVAQGPFGFPNRPVSNRSLHIGKWLLIYQNVIARVVQDRYVCVVIGHEVKFVSNMILFMLRKLSGRPVMLWGQGFHVRSGAEEGRSAGVTGAVVARAKVAMCRMADGYIVYTRGGAEKLVGCGVPPQRVWPVQNTFDLSAAHALQEAYAQVDRRDLLNELHLDPTKPVLLFVGRLVAGKRVDELLDVERLLNSPEAERASIVIIGEGPERTSLEQRAKGRCNVHFRGAVYEPELIAKYMRVAMAVVVPGPVGLIVNQAFAHGVPVVTRSAPDHGPEVEYIEDGVNGMVVTGPLPALAEVVGRLLDEPMTRDSLAQGALTTRDELSLESMVDAFDRAVLTTIARRQML